MYCVANDHNNINGTYNCFCGGSASNEISPGPLLGVASPSLAVSVVQPDVGDLEGLQCAEFLKSIGQAEGVIEVKPLENIQPPVKPNLPSSVGYDVPCMYRPGTIDLPCEGNVGSSRSLLDRGKVSRLLVGTELVSGSDEMELDLLIGGLSSAQSFPQTPSDFVL